MTIIIFLLWCDLLIWEIHWEGQHAFLSFGDLSCFSDGDLVYFLLVCPSLLARAAIEPHLSLLIHRVLFPKVSDLWFSSPDLDIVETASDRFLWSQMSVWGKGILRASSSCWESILIYSFFMLCMCSTAHWIVELEKWEQNFYGD